MGIDKKDIRFIVHYQMPASPIHYYQEIGRAGRDGEAAWCVLLYDPEDLTIQEHFIRNAKPESKCYETILSLLRATPQGLREGDLMRITGFSQTTTRTILTDLEDQRLVERDRNDRSYVAIVRTEGIMFHDYDIVRAQKLQELNDIQNYAQYQGCYMDYLTAYLGDPPGYTCGACGHCHPAHFPSLEPSKRMQDRAVYFLEKECLPRIEKRGSAKAPVHEAGWSLSFHGDSHIGKLVRASKHEGAGPFATELLVRAVEVIRTRYPIHLINAIVSVPPTRSGVLVEQFARQIADALAIEYLPVLVKIRDTREQKYCTNWLQKIDNVKGAFMVRSRQEVAGRTLLLIDDIYDSGYMLREVGRVLMQAGASAIYPFTITRTRHSDDQ
jgi:ATP-dependent DNA helicase RecQ